MRTRGPDPLGPFIGLLDLSPWLLGLHLVPCCLGASLSGRPESACLGASLSGRPDSGRLTEWAPSLPLSANRSRRLFNRRLLLKAFNWSFWAPPPAGAQSLSASSCRHFHSHFLKRHLAAIFDPVSRRLRRPASRRGRGFVGGGLGALKGPSHPPSFSLCFETTGVWVSRRSLLLLPPSSPPFVLLWRH